MLLADAERRTDQATALRTKSSDADAASAQLEQNARKSAFLAADQKDQIKQIISMPLQRATCTLFLFVFVESSAVEMMFRAALCARPHAICMRRQGPGHPRRSVQRSRAQAASAGKMRFTHTMHHTSHHHHLTRELSQAKSLMSSALSHLKTSEVDEKRCAPARLRSDVFFFCEFSGFAVFFPASSRPPTVTMHPGTTSTWTDTAKSCLASTLLRLSATESSPSPTSSLTLTVHHQPHFPPDSTKLASNSHPSPSATCRCAPCHHIPHPLLTIFPRPHQSRSLMPKR